MNSNTRIDKASASNSGNVEEHGCGWVLPPGFSIIHFSQVKRGVTRRDHICTSIRVQQEGTTMEIW